MANLILAVSLGSLIGVERQWRQRMAGLRTHALVAAGSALFVLLSQRLPNGGDKTRMAAYVISGVGFLGAGVIMVVLGTHLLLRPVAQRINRQSSESNEQELHYQIRIVCREEEETQVRFLVLQAVSASLLSLRSLNSEDLNGSKKVAVTADVDSSTRSNSILERVVNRLSLEKGVTAASWVLSPKEEAA